MLNSIMSIVTQAVLSILGLLATAAIAVIAAYVNTKRQAVIAKIGVDQYNSTYQIAKGVYFATEQAFKGLSAAADLKRQKFDELLLNKIPGLTQDEIDHFRESIVGEINAQVTKDKILEPAIVQEAPQQ